MTLALRRTESFSVRPALFVLALATSLTNIARAEPPAVKALVPAGVQRGTSAEVRAVGKLGTRPVSVWSSTPGLSFEIPEKGESFTVTTDEDVPVGIHWLRIHNAEGASALRPFAVGTLAEIVETETNDGVDGANAVDAAGTVANGVLAKTGDVDGYTVELEQGRTLVATVAANRDLGSPMDAVLQIVDERGFVLDQNDDERGNDPRLVFPCQRSGRYVVRLFAFPASPDSSIRLAGSDDYVYRLTLTTGPYVDHLVPLAVERSGNRRVASVGWNLPAESDPHEVEVGEGAADVRHVGFGPLDAVPLAVVEHPSRIESEVAGGPLVPPVTITGHVAAPGEVDEFAFEGVKGRPLALRIESRSLGFPLDAAIEVLDATGKSLKSADDAQRESFDPVLDFDPPADGVYRVRVRDVFGAASPRHAYRLSIEPRVPHFALSLAADRFTVEAGKSVKVPVTIDRRNGFAEPIEVRAEGLPAGVTAAAVTSEAKGDTKAKVELVLEASAEALASGPFRITSGDRTATAPIEGLDDRTGDPWLVVRPKK